MYFARLRKPRAEPWRCSRRPLIASVGPLSSNSRKNQIYKAFREVGRVMRTVALLRFLADSGLRARVTAATNKAEAYNGVLRLDPGSATRA